MLSCVKIVSPLSGYVWPLERISGSVLTQGIPGRAVEHFKSTINFRNGNMKVTARSVTAMMAREVTHRAKVQVLASGVDSKVAVEQLMELLAQSGGDAGHVPVSATATTTLSPTAAPASSLQSIRSEKAPAGSKLIP